MPDLDDLRRASTEARVLDLKAELQRLRAREAQRHLLGERIAAVLADLVHVRAKGATTHHDACWDEHIGCLAARITATLTGEDTDHA